MNITVLMTGATDGIGKQIAYKLTGGGCIDLLGRDEDKCKRTIAEISGLVQVAV
jgi:short-subunit dehydrogenase